jgi:hypothetical protein
LSALDRCFESHKIVAIIHTPGRLDNQDFVIDQPERSIGAAFFDKDPPIFFLYTVQNSSRRKIVRKAQLRMRDFGGDDHILVLKDVDLATAHAGQFAPTDPCIRRCGEGQAVLQVRAHASQRHELFVRIRLKAAQDIVGSDIGIPSRVVRFVA